MRRLERSCRQVINGLTVPLRLITAAALLAALLIPGLAQVPKQRDLIIWGQALGPDSKGTEALVHAFAAAYPQYNVRLLSLGTGGMDPQKLMTSIVGNVAPDLVFQDRFTVGDWASRGAFLPLDHYLQRDAADPNCPKPSDYYAAVWNEGTFGGHVYGIPYGADDRILYYNKKIFADNADKLRAAGCDPTRPPRTWSEMLAYGKALNEFNSDGTIKRAGFLPNFGNSWLYLYSFQMNGQFLSDDGKTCTLNTEANREALDYMVKGYDLFKLPGETAAGYEKARTFQSGFLNNENDPFLVGKVAMKVDGDWILQDIIKYAPSLDLGNAPAPVPDDRYNHTGVFKDEKETYITWTGGFCYSIPKGSRNPDAAWDFIKFALNTKGRLIEHYGNRDWARHFGRSYIPRMAASIPGNAAIYKEFSPADPKFANALKIHMQMLEHSRVRPPTFVAQLLWDQQVKVTEDACSHKDTVEGALSAAQAVVQRDLDEFYHQDQYPVINLWIPFFLFVGMLLVFLAWGIFSFRRKRLGPLAKSEARWGYLFISPWMIGFIVLMLGPMLASLFFSFTYYNVLTPARWDGLKNYHDMFTTDWGETWKAFSNVGYLAFVGVPLNIFTGLSIALLLNAGVRGIRFYRTIFYLPAIVPTIASAVLWLWILYGDPHRGLLNAFWDNTITHWLGISPPGWISAEAWSKPALIIMGAWGAGSGMVLWLAGLKGIPTTLYEASSIDGATPRQQFWSVTLPQLSPVLFFNVVMGFIGALQEFDRVYVMAPTGSDNGAMGPGESLLVPVYKLFHEGFAYFKMGSASALAWAIFIIILLITGFQFWLSKSWVHYEVEN